MSNEQIIFYSWIEAIGLTSIVFGSLWVLLRKYPKIADAIGLGKDKELNTLEKLYVEGTEYQRHFLKTIKEELKEGYEFQGLEFIDSERIDEQQRKQGFHSGLLLSWGGGAYRWIWKLDENGSILEIVGQYQDWFLPFVNVKTTKTQQTEMIRLLKKVKVYN